jgi:hypothetical protein
VGGWRLAYSIEMERIVERSANCDVAAARVEDVVWGNRKLKSRKMLWGG